jgi:DNA replication protein DnaC
MNDSLTAKLKYLQLDGLLAHWDDYLKLAADQRWSDTRLLTHVIEEEYRLKRGRRRQRRLQNALLPEPWAIESYPFQRQPKLDQKKLVALYDSLDYMRLSQNVIWMGGPGVGKTGLATSFLTHAIDQGHSGRYVLFADLLTQFYQSVADHSEGKVLKQYLAYDCLLIDELGYVEVEPVQVGLFFTLMHRRHKKKPTLITSNLGFAEWGTFLKNPHLTAALVDRLTENSHVFNMRHCVSLRAPLHSGQDQA